MAKNIILLTIDTLRRDHCSCYGYKRETTPFLDEVAKRGIKFKYCFANGPLTPRSFPSILCGINTFEGKEDDIQSYFLPKGVETIAQKLKKRGYYTAAFQAGNPFISSFYGYDRGFDFFEDFLKGSSKCEKIERPMALTQKFVLKVDSFLNFSPKFKNMVKKQYRNFNIFRDIRKYIKKLENNEIPFIQGDELNEMIAKWLGESSEKESLFLWIHYMDVHQPFIPKRDICKSLNIPVYNDKIIAKHWAEILNHQVKNSKQVTELKDLYDCEIRYEDMCIEELFNIFKKNNLTEENTFFILTADHGDEFGEHGGLGHELKLYNEMLSVPLIFVGKGSEKYDKFTDSLVELKDIPQVVLDIAKGECVTDISKEHVLSQSLRRDGENRFILISLQNKQFKLIYDAGSEANNEFYNLSSDPYEKNNLINNKLYKREMDKFTSVIKEFLKSDGHRSKFKNMTIRKIKELERLGKI